MSEDLHALKEQLALACRMLANEHLFDQSGHLSARHPDGNLALIHPHGTARYDVTAGDILTIDLDGNVIEGNDRAPSEVFIHTQIYRARPDVGCVVHAHSRLATVFSIAGVELLPVSNYGAFLGKGPVPVYPDPRLVHTPVMGDALAHSLAEKRACLMRNHGSVIVGERIREAVVGAFNFEENAIRQHLAMQIGQPCGYTDDELADVAAANWREKPIEKIWDYHVSLARRAGLA